ncbi:ral guanine nucleotide dissociation stimulator-like 1 [Scleropages formosus]|uniref:Ral guanine nucleotide dissociation stimulator-like 1 n=1 Tax=Scleropages formosus TaxID=113540 RepID=A0A8C9RZU2_SCLFO|nr:ral guanine nucleotide dissociation stimulator-like 3 [Scleropages formosus]XP_018594246.1 ral guanine nucleotide dissociation stimulator-like 3 [Scleropages formosus]
MGKWELTMDPVQEWGEEVENGVVYGITLRREPVSPQSDSTEDRSAFVQYRTCKVRRLKAASLDNLVTHLVNRRCQEQDYIHIFLSMYRTFTSTDKFIQLLFQSVSKATDANGSNCHLSSLMCIIKTWLEAYGDDFWEPPEHPSLQLLCTQLHLHLCLQNLAQHADHLLKKFLEEEKYTNHFSPGMVCSQALLQEQLEIKSADEDPEYEDSEDLKDFMDFPVLSIAEQLTRQDAELFIKVVPFQCLGCIWSQRDKKTNLCPTIRATIAQFNAITNRVITSLLCCPTPTHSTTRGLSCGPAQRARVIEKWIQVAEECRHLKNFSSLKAILSALQSNAIYRLKKTWAAVCRESVATFDNLCETFPDENCVLASGQILVEDGSQQDEQHSSPKSLKHCPISKQMSTTGGSVPYLGTYLTVLTMLDTALPDFVEGDLINFEKRRKEYEIISQISQLQSSCEQYVLPSHPRITQWLQSSKILTDQESHDLSQELEPPIDSCPGSPSPWSYRLFSKLLPLSEGTNTKTLADQASVSSFTSCSCETEEMSSPNSSPQRLQSLSSSCQNVEDIFSSTRTTPSEPCAQSSSTYSSQPDLSVPAPGNVSPVTCRPISQYKRSVSMTSLPVYNRQVDDSCIVRVSIESGNNGNMYKSILLTSQDKTEQVIQRALQKHNLEGISCNEFTLSQVLPQDKELLIPDKANVFYAMSTSANYDFVLRQQQVSHRKRPLGSSSSFRLLRRANHAL